MNQRKKILVVGLITLVIIFIAFFIIRDSSFEAYDQTYRVTEVIDGDTFEIATGDIVRMICVDAPERGEEGYGEATQYLSNLILDKDVELVQDVSHKDAYARLLRYVYLKDGTFVNKEIVKSGHAEVFPYEPDTEKCDEIGT